MGFGGGVEGRSDIVTMDGNPQQEQGGPSSSEVRVNQAPLVPAQPSEVNQEDIWRELEGRPEILRMDQNPQQPALPLNPHALPAIPHAEQQPEIAPAAEQLPLLEGQWVTDRENIVGDLICELRRKDRLRLPAPHRLQRIIECLEEKYDVESLPAMIRDLRANGQYSIFYRDLLTFSNELKLKGVSEATLKKYAKDVV